MPSASQLSSSQIDRTQHSYLLRVVPGIIMIFSIISHIPIFRLIFHKQMIIQFLLVNLYGNQIFEIKRVSAFILEKKLALSTVTTKEAKSSDTPPTVDKKRSKAVTRSKERSSSTNPTTDRTLSKIPSSYTSFR